MEEVTLLSKLDMVNEKKSDQSALSEEQLLKHYEEVGWIEVIIFLFPFLTRNTLELDFTNVSSKSNTLSFFSESKLASLITASTYL